MKKIRIGKDIALKWAILTNGESLSLEERDLKLILTSPLSRKTDLQFTVEGNVLSTKIDGISQKGVGTYNLTLWENYGKIGQTALDACNAFSLVRTTCEEDDGDESLRTETVQLSGDIEVLSAKDYNVLKNKPLINGVELKGDKTLEELGIQAKGNFATKEEIPTKVSQLNNDSGYISRVPDEYVTETELEQKGYATKQEIPDVEEFVKTSDADKKYQPKGDYLTEIPDEYINSDELSESLKNYATKTDLSGKQDKGDYALKSEIPNISGLATKEELSQAITQATQDLLTKTDAAGTYATKQSLEELSVDVEQLKLSQSPYSVAGWDPDELAPESVSFFCGIKDILMKYDFYLLDTTDNTRQTTKPVGKLMRNNLLRFADGSFAPTIGITEAQRAECDVELYLDEAHQQKYCDAGAFDAEAFYNEHGMAKLYNSEGAEVRVLRPWETTETKYTIGIARADTVYLLDNVIGESGKAWKGIFTNPVVWDGIEVSKYPLVPTAIGPGPACTVNKKTRNFLYLYKGEGNCQSGKGQDNLCTMFYDQEKTYPRVNDMQQINNMTYARSNNADADAPYPFAEGGYHALNTLITELEVLYGTKYLHNANMFGSGISSNDSCANEGNWLVNGGVRYKKNGTEIWTYAKWSDQKDIYYNATGGRTHFSALINSEYPKEACMESQMAFSFAMETGVPEDTDFEFYGYTYRYVSVPGTDGTASMNVRVYKVMSQTFTAFTSDGTEQSWDVEVNLRMSLYSGVNLAGDIFMYCGGGYEQVGTCLYPTNASLGNPIKFYLQPDQLKWHTEKSSFKTELGVFDFESQYLMIGEGTNLGNGYALRRLPYAPWKIEKGGSISTGECMYAWDDNYWSTTLNQRVRLACRARGYAYYSFCSPRNLTANTAVTYAIRNFGGSAQALIE